MPVVQKYQGQDMRWLSNLVRELWRISRSSWVEMDPSLRPGSRASALMLFFFLIFLPIGLVLVLLGFDLGDVDSWIDRQAGWLDLVGTLAFKGLGALILLLCLFGLFGGLWQQESGMDRPDAGEEDQRVGWGCMLLLPIPAYFGWLMMTG